MKTARDREYAQYLWEVKLIKKVIKSILERLAALCDERKELNDCLKYCV
jgi:hypothetical protein